MASRRAFAAALAALPFARPTEEATIPDIHQLQPAAISSTETDGVLKVATVLFRDPNHASLIGKTYGFYGTPLVCTKESRNDGVPYGAFFEEINL